jgi:hypothetical protein
MKRVSDEVVDAVVVSPATDYAARGHAPLGDEDVRRVLEAFVSVNRADGEFLVEGARRQESRATDAGAFAFHDVSGQDGVVIEVGAGRTIVVSQAAFGRLMDRLGAALSDR